jgi:hypothetical protein
MALKFKINKSAFEKLSDEMKNEYIAGENDGEYVLDVSDLPKGEDVGPVKRALEAEKNKSKGLKAQLDEANGKIEAMPNIDELKANHEKETGKLKTFADKSLRESVATELAAKISTAPALLKPIILARLSVDLSGDEPKTIVLGPDGKPAADFTIDKLREELVANKDYKTIMIGSKATGGGAPGTGTKPLGGGAPKVGEQEDGKVPDLSAMKPDAFAERISARLAAKAEAAAGSEAA